MYSKLVRPIPEGPVDVVGDVHGEIEALNDLLAHLGYETDGRHPEGRRLVFVGDLIDRGPDSPGVLRKVRRMVEDGRALTVLGNHELNLLRGLNKGFDNAWFFKGLTPSQQGEMIELMTGLPIALERPDLRVAHANWHDDSVDIARNANCPVELYEEHELLIEEFLTQNPELGRLETALLKQNQNPVKRITSGPEQALTPGTQPSGERSFQQRETWWETYVGPLCVVGHYWRSQDVEQPTHNHLFDDTRPHALLGLGHVMCVDYSVGKRFQERQRKGADFKGPFHLRLGALRLPERLLVFDDGATVPVA